MSAHTKMHPTKISHPIFCISEHGLLYQLPRSILNKYLITDKNIKTPFNVDPAEAFAEINKKYTKVGALLKAIRLREGLNQKQFAALIKVTQGDLSKMERGKRPVGKQLASRIAKKFGSKIL